MTSFLEPKFVRRFDLEKDPKVLLTPIPEFTKNIFFPMTKKIHRAIFRDERGTWKSPNPTRMRVGISNIFQKFLYRPKIV